MSLVGEAGDALTKIVNSVTDISGHVTEIAVSAQQQSSGLIEINASVNQLEHLTRENAAVFQQTIVAGQSLHKQAETLTATMAAFEFGQKNIADVVAIKTPSPERVKSSFTSARSTGNLAMAPVPDDIDEWTEF